jgi:hypothetical protein
MRYQLDLRTLAYLVTVPMLIAGLAGLLSPHPRAIRHHHRRAAGLLAAFTVGRKREDSKGVPNEA